MSESSNMRETVLEDGTELDGSIRSKCPITVSGKLKGDISAPSLTITPSGSVFGKVKVSELKSEGAIAGEIDAESVALSGHVSDQTVIRATSLQVTLSQNGTNGKLQVTFGNCEVQVGEPVALSDRRLLQGKKEESKHRNPQAGMVPAAQTEAEIQG